MRELVEHEIELRRAEPASPDSRTTVPTEKTKQMSDLKPYPDRSGDGVPYCTYEKCPQYDGKRCDLMGQRPSWICEPAVQDLVKENKKLKRTLKSLEQKIKTLEGKKVDG